VRAAFQAPIYLQHLETDGTPDFLIEVRDADRDGHPDLEWIDAWPNAPSGWGVHRTELMVNPEDDEPPIMGSIFWPFLGSGFGFNKDYQKSFPPVRVDWNKAAVASIGEFVASRFNDNSWFVYSIRRVRPAELSPVNFEAPFAFYDLAADDDGYPELQIRFVQSLVGDLNLVRSVGVRGTNPVPIQVIRYSWDQDNNRSWDFKIGLIGRHTVSETVQVDNLLLRMVPPSVLPDWINDREWDGATFAAAETDRYWTSEGIYAWGPSEMWRDGFITGLLDAPPEEEYQTIDPGFRGEYAFDFHARPMLYFSPLDRKLHLLKARGGVWNVDDTGEVRYANLDGDAYLDQWQYLEGGELRRQLNLAAGHLVYAGDGEVWLKQAEVPPALFESMLPRNHEEWLALGHKLEQYRRDFAPGDFEAMMKQFDGPTARIQGATLRDSRLTESGFRFVLELSPGFRWDSELPITGASGLKPGTYLVQLSGESLSMVPLTPPVLSIRGNRLAFETQTITELNPLRMKVVMENRGLQDVKSLRVHFYAEQNGMRQVLDEVEATVPGEGHQVVSTLWMPRQSGVWTIGLEVEAQDEGLLAGGITTASVATRVTVRPAPRSSWAEFLALGGEQPLNGLFVPALAASMATAGMALFLLLMRKVDTTRYEGHDA
jgi:hypothetical protein